MLHLRPCIVLLSLLAAACLPGCTTIATPLTLSDQQRSAVREAQDYLNGLTLFRAQFTQSGFAGAGSGVLWLDRPGRLRVTYYGASAREMVANSGLFVIYDHATGATTTMPVSRTALGLLLADHISLTGSIAITGFTDAPDHLQLTLQDSAHPEQGTLTVVMHRAPFTLVAVVATDVHGRSLALQLGMLDLHPRITDDLFRFPGPPQS